MTATVTGSAPTGNVQFFDGGAALAGCNSIVLSGTGNAKTATCLTTSLAVGTHSITAIYSGDAGNGASSSSTLAQTITAPASFGNLGFETPALSGGYQYAPDGASWTFTGPAGIAGNGNAFTGGNPAAPQGVQVGFIQVTGRIGQAATLSSGQYYVGFRAAQRGSGQSGVQVIDVLLDGALIGQFQPGSSSYVFYQTPVFTITSAGGHLVELVGAGSGSDYTALIDDVRIATPEISSSTTALASSSNPAPAGSSVTLTATVTGTTPTGTVQFSEAGVAIPGCEAVALVGGGNSTTAACTTAGLAMGSHAITAIYDGDASNGASSSSVLSQTISAAAAFGNLGFETPGLAGAFQYAPAGASWTFSTGAGIAGNGSAFTSGNAGRAGRRAAGVPADDGTRRPDGDARVRPVRGGVPGGAARQLSGGHPGRAGGRGRCGRRSVPAGRQRVELLPDAGVHRSTPRARIRSSSSGRAPAATSPRSSTTCGSVRRVRWPRRRRA